MPRPLTVAAQVRKDKLNDKGSSVLFQHRHFATVAAWIATVPAQPMRIAVAEFFADKFAGTNAKFDRKRFLRACGTLS